MSTALSKREVNALRKEHRKAISQAMKVALKGSGWRPKIAYSLASKDISGIYAACAFEFCSAEPKAEMKFSCRIKSMSADPLFWEIMHLSGNESQPLNFRSIGAFTCYPPELINEGCEGTQPDVVAANFRAFLSRAHSAVEENPASMVEMIEAVRRAQKRTNKTDYFTIHVIELLLESRWPEARAMLEHGLEQNLSKFFGYYADEQADFQRHPRRSFAEMALHWMDQKGYSGRLN